MSHYAWIITADRLSVPGDEYDATGTVGPRNISPEQESRLRAGKGREFRLFDDDRILLYEGRIIGEEHKRTTGFEPLDDFGEPMAGATTIKYRNGHKWEVL